MTHRSWLFVPGDSPSKMAKAIDSGADALILDLEDSVGAEAKGDARHAVRNLLRHRPGAGGPELWVRINPLSTADAALDLAVVAPLRPDGIVLPKPDSAEEVRQLGDLLRAHEAGAPGRPIPILPIATETPLSVFNLQSYRTSGPRLAALAWGAEDLSSAVGAMTYRTESGAFAPLYDMARALVIAAAAAADVPAIETVYPAFRDLDGLATYAANGRRDGFTGMMAIHPAQVPVINAAFTPTLAELDEARQIVALFEKSPGSGVLSFNGRMLDAPHLKQARRLLARVRPAS